MRPQTMIQTEIEKDVAGLKELSKLPVVVGFGITTAKHAAEIARYADGIVVGSAFVALIHRHKDSANLAASVTTFAANLKKALGPPPSLVLF